MTENCIKGKILLKGISGSPGCVTGKVRLVKGTADLKMVQKGDIIVADKLEPDPEKWGMSASEFDAQLKKAGAIIQNTGGSSSHGNIIAKEIGVPAISGTVGYGEEATQVLKDGMTITIDGRVDFESKKNLSGQVVEKWWGAVYAKENGGPKSEIPIAPSAVKPTLQDLMAKYHLGKK